MDSDDDNEEVDCFGCQRPILSAGPAYSCTPCNFPNEINHALHPNTLLSLLQIQCPVVSSKNVTHPVNLSGASPTLVPSASFTCTSHVHHCLGVDTFINPPPAIRFLFFSQTAPTRTAHTPTCNACDIWEGISYLCMTCLFWVHPNCSLLPTFMGSAQLVDS
ncbi:hypothetical protein CsSME_00023347 [Camellia sinensis var. sinensis]